MDERDRFEGACGTRLKLLICKRTGEQIEPAEHERCPYCFGLRSEIERGRHETFCDYREGVDPVNFGFPEEDARTRKG